MIRRAALACAALGACHGNLPATEIVVTIDSAFGVPCTIDALHIEATGAGATVATDIAIGDADLPGSITLVPRTTGGEVTVAVTGMRGGAPFATARGAARFDQDDSLELRFVLDRSCVPGPCPAVGVGGFAGLPARQPRRGCGERGYAWHDALFVMRDACAMHAASMASALLDADEREAASPLSPAVPFPFRFYGAPVTQIWAGTNGYLGLGETRPNALTAAVGASRSLGEPGFPGKGVLAFWDDLRTGPSGVCFAVSGEFPDRMLWITWKEACFGPSDPMCGGDEAGALTFGAALEETTDRIYVGYRAMTAAIGNVDRARGLTAVIGVTDAAPRGCPDNLCSTGGVCQDGTPCGYTQVSSRTVLNPLPAVEFDPQ